MIGPGATLLALGLAMAQVGPGGPRLGAPSSLAESVVQSLQRALPKAEVWIENAGTVRVRLPGEARDAARGVYLDNLAAQVDGCSPDQRAAEIRRFVAGVREATEGRPAPFSTRDLRLVLRSRAYIERLRARFAKPEQRILARPFGPDLVVAIVIDAPRTMRFLQQKDLRHVERGGGDAFTQAQAWTAAASGAPKAVLRPHARGRFGVVEDTYAPSWLLRPVAWHHLVAADTEVLAAAPARGSLVYAVDPDPAAREAFRRIVGRLHASAARPLSARVFRWTRAGFVPAP